MHLLPESLVERLKTRQAVLVAGLSCAELAGLPGWPALLERLAEWIEEEAAKQVFLTLLRNGQLATAAALLRDLVAPDALGEVLLDAYPATTPVPELIRSVASAPWRGIIATGYDGLWAKALAEQGEKPERLAFAAHAASIEPGRGRFLLQLFGRPDLPDTVCLGPSEIAAKVVAPGASKFLAGLHQKWSFVFLGFGPDDPDLAMLAGRLLGANPSTADHYLVTPGLSAWDARRVRAETGLIPVAVEGTAAEVYQVIAEACRLAGDKLSPEDVEAWLERLTAEPENEEAREMLEQGLAVLCEKKEWERFVAALISKVELEPDPKEQSADLYEAGTVLDKELAAPDRAFPVLMMALHLRPHDAELLADAKRVADASGQGEAFHEELAEIEKETAGAAEAEEIALNVAHLLAEDPARQDEAIAAFQRLLDRNPDHASALAGLESVLRKNERWDALGTLLRKAAQRDPANADIAAKLEEVFERTQQNTPLVELLTDRLAQKPDDQPTLAKLESLHQKKQDWAKLVSLHQQALERNSDDAEALAKLEDIYQQTQQWQELGALYQTQLAKDSGDTAVLDKIETLYRRSEQWQALADHLGRRAAQKTSEEARPLQQERAGILLDRVGDVDGAMAIARAFLPGDAAAAEAIFTKCAERDAAHPAPLLALAELARAQGDHDRAAKLLLDAAERTQSPRELGRLFAEAGVLHLEELDDEVRAVECLEGALASDPEQVMAAEKLLAVREKHEDWEKAEPLLELLVRKTEDGPARCEMYQRQARCARRQGKLDHAATALAAAAALDPQSLPLARELADLQAEREAWPLARTEYERAKGLTSAETPVEIRVSLCEQLARCALKAQDDGAAVRYHEEVLGLEPGKRETLEALVELRAQRGEWQEVVKLKRKLLELASADDDRARLLEDIGDLLQEKQDDWKGAMDVYKQVLALDPDRRQVLYKALDYYTQEKRWERAIATLQRLAELADAPAERAKLNYTVAAIYRDELKDTDKAVEQFGKALDDEPLHPKAFDAIEKLLGEAKEWKELERAYRKQIKRLPPDAPGEVKLRLWDGLADVALKQHDKESAMLTMEVAVKFDRDNLARQERLAKMYFDMGPAQAEKAIAQHQYLLQHKPDRLDSYKALAALFFQGGAHDKMWCVAGAMTCLGKADPPLRALFENYRPTQTPSAAGKLTGELWRKVVHPDENPYLDALFALLSPALTMTTAQPRKALGLDRHTRVDVSANTWPYAAALRYVANTIESAVPEVFIKKDAPGTVNVVNLKDKSTLTPSLVIGIGFEQLGSQSEVIFDLAKRMVQLRPERFPRFALATVSALDVAIRAGLQLGGSPIGAGDHPQEVEQMVKHLEGALATPLRTELKSLAKRYVDVCGTAVDIVKWIVASDLTAARAALVLCGDIVAASRVLAIEPTGLSPLSVTERMHDLLAYFVSEDHFAVRAALGMQVNITPPSEPAGSRPRRMSHMQIKTQW
jgi:tetratricopeptide (TPR) repeat protein